VASGTSTSLPGGPSQKAEIETRRNLKISKTINQQGKNVFTLLFNQVSFESLLYKKCRSPASSIKEQHRRANMVAQAKDTIVQFITQFIVSLLFSL
jgi:hypothetical protein